MRSGFDLPLRAGRAPDTQVMREKRDLARIVFTDGVAVVETPVALLNHIKFKNDVRGPGPRLDAVRRSIQSRGYIPTDPIVARIGQRGRWIIVDGGHRLTALRGALRSFWARLLGPPGGMVYFILYETERSWAKAQQKGRRARKSD